MEGTKCQNKFDYIIFEMLVIKDLKPTLNNLVLSVQDYLFRSEDKSLLLFIVPISLCPPFVILQVFYHLCYIFYCFLVIMVFVNYF